MKETVLELNWLDIILIVIALLSIVGNLIQGMIWWRDQKRFYLPIEKSVVGLFNTIKHKINHTAWTQGVISNPNNPHKEIATLKHEYSQYIQSIATFLLGLQETVVSIYMSFNPSDKKGEEAFKASEFGLSDEDKEVRILLRHVVMKQKGLKPPEEES
jgi:hypothetical protein